MLLRDGMRILIHLVTGALLVGCGGKAKGKATMVEVDNSSSARDTQRGETSKQPDATITATTGEDLSWLRTVYFAFDSSDLSVDTRETLAKLADWLAAHPKVAITIEGHCDEQGTTEYNIALGQRRAQAMVDYLARMGTSARRLTAVSYGAERPADDGHDEVAWSKNRRGEFRVAQ